MRAQRSSLHCLIPPYILDILSKSEDPAVRKQAVDAIEASATTRAVRTTLSTMLQMAAIPSPAAAKGHVSLRDRGVGRVWPRLEGAQGGGVGLEGGRVLGEAPLDERRVVFFTLTELRQ